MSKASDVIKEVKDIRVLQSVMYLWLENNSWIVEYQSGQMRPKIQFTSKSEAINFVQTKIEDYWRRVRIPGG